MKRALLWSVLWTCLSGMGQMGCAVRGESSAADKTGAIFQGSEPGRKPPIYISFHWHMHQPIYWPYESVVETEARQRFPYSVIDVHSQRTGPYTTFARDAIASGLGLGNLGAQVSLSGSLMENLDSLERAGVGFAQWTRPWQEANGWKTTDGHPRLDLVGFGYHHPLMGLLETEDIRMQIQAHRESLNRHFPQATSKGFFPPECAFSPRMIPALLAEGIEWVLVDNIHFDRAHRDYPFRPASNLQPPNRADARNDTPTEWLELRDLWCPSAVSAPFGYRPHWVEHIDPLSGGRSRIIAVPAARYEGNEDGRGGFGALQYEKVFAQYEHLNTDSTHPMLVVLHHDGDNYGAGSDSYYHQNFQRFVAWATAQPQRFVPTTIQDYLERFPPDPTDVVHVEDGSWSGADNGDPQFAKWNGAPGADGYSPDQNSWAVIVAAKNRVLAAEAVLPHSSMSAIADGSGNDTDRAWHHLLNAETSCYWYWDGSLGGLWDSHPTRAANLAVGFADRVLRTSDDRVGPTLYLPQRIPYNPGLNGETRDFAVWTLVDDVSGVDQVTLHWRVSSESPPTPANDLLEGGKWSQAPMTESAATPRTDPLPRYQASKYTGRISGLADQLVDYYVSATDSRGRLSRSPLQHVWVSAR